MQISESATQNVYFDLAEQNDLSNEVSGFLSILLQKKKKEKKKNNPPSFIRTQLQISEQPGDDSMDLQKIWFFCLLVVVWIFAVQI